MSIQPSQAKQFLTVFRRGTPTINRSTLTEFLTPSEINEAFARRWLVVHDGMAISLTNSPPIIQEIKRLSEIEEKDPEVGDPVTIVDNGVSYTGVVQAKDGNGYRVSFAQRGPSTANRAFQREELRVMPKDGQEDSAPAQPTSQTSTPARNLVMGVGAVAQ